MKIPSRSYKYIAAGLTVIIAVLTGQDLLDAISAAVATLSLGGAVAI